MGPCSLVAAETIVSYCCHVLTAGPEATLAESLLAYGPGGRVRSSEEGMSAGGQSRKPAAHISICLQKAEHANRKWERV